ncbi:MAG: hypothetical protein QXI11_03320 [Thermoproteota archaeon]
MIWFLHRIVQASEFYNQARITGNEQLLKDTLSLLEFLNLGPVAKGNLNALSLLASMTVFLGLTKLLSPIIKVKQELKFKMESQQQELVFRLFAWFKKHKDICLLMLMLAFPMFAPPICILCSWMITVGIPAFLALTCSLSVFLFFFLFFSVSLSIFHESVVRPAKASISQIERIINTFYASKQLDTEKLEKAKRTEIRIPTKKTRGLVNCISIAFISTLVVAQIVELQFPQESTTLTPFLLIIQATLIFALIAIPSLGEKKTLLDLILSDIKRYEKEDKVNDK